MFTLFHPLFHLLVSLIYGLVMATVFSLAYSGADHEPGDLPRQPNWPKGSYQWVNQPFRVHGYWVNFYDQFFYQQVNEELEKMVNGLARLPDVELRVILHAGKGQAKSPWSKAAVCPADWAVSFSGQFVPSDDGRETVRLRKSQQVVVDIWTGGQVELGKLKLPAGVDLRSGGEIDNFIRQHELKARSKSLPDKARKSAAPQTGSGGESDR